MRDEKARIFRAIAPLDPKHIVRGQFRGFREEPGVPGDSTVETFAAAELRVESWRWAGVPFFVRAGKCLTETAFEVWVQLKTPPLDVYREKFPTRQYFRFSVGPDVSTLALGMHIKRPGEAMAGRQVELLASQDEARDMLAYERLLGDAMHGDASLFARQDAIEAQWRIVDPVLDLTTPAHPYDPGSWGPPEADRLVAAIHGGWREPAGAKPQMQGGARESR
jgi:glucose-6-phosphate 1-dehydrogenase